MAVPNNEAAWITGAKVRPLQVGPAPYTKPGPHELVIKNAAVALNPVDMSKQILGDLFLRHVTYPYVLGGDVVGEVFEVGSAVTRFKPGDRVMAHAASLCPFSAGSPEGAFQRYTVVREHLAAVVPDSIPDEQACVIPLCLSAAAYGLFHPDFLGLDSPTVPPRPPNGKAVIITSGASSVGCNGIQLAVAAGYEVYTTASPKNFDLVRRLGASHVFDYHSPTVTDDVKSALQGKTLAGALAINNGSVELCTAVLGSTNGSKMIASAGPPWPKQLPQTGLAVAGFIAQTLWWSGATAVRGAVNGVQSKFIDALDLPDAESVCGKLVYRSFITQALEKGQFVPAPSPLVVGRGLERIQGGLDILAKGMSAQKVVVLLS